MRRALIPLPLVLLVAACGSGTGDKGSTPGLNPRDALNAGVQKLLAGHDLVSTLKLHTTPKALIASYDDGSSDPMTTDQAKAIIGGSVVATVHAPTSLGAAGSSPQSLVAAGGTASVTVRAGTGATAELRLVKGAAYARADVQRFADLLTDPGGAKAGLAVASVAAPERYRKAVKALVAGDWVGVPPAAVTEALPLLGGGDPALILGGFGAPDYSVQVVRALLGKATVTRVSRHGNDDHLQLSIGLAEASAILQKVVRASLPSGFSTDDEQSPSPLPEQTETVDVVVRDGVLSEVDVDVAADLTPEDRARLHGDPFSVSLSLSPASVDVTSPSEPVIVDPTVDVQRYVKEIRDFYASLPSCERERLNCGDASLTEASPVPGCATPSHFTESGQGGAYSYSCPDRGITVSSAVPQTYDCLASGSFAPGELPTCPGASSPVPGLAPDVSCAPPAGGMPVSYACPTIPGPTFPVLRTPSP